MALALKYKTVEKQCISICRYSIYVQDVMLLVFLLKQVGWFGSLWNLT